ncbi:30S ribosomal protein S13 [Alphaproteobacteria bacterium endosymbiont of Tiliacea citrago]|uniref:30S ribosomal protein S13 n=1 Tax=Alphaproteobacteria bacterium endosymbiont of Tiliacea citrago TaxID=3077944 RepID=UPI00313AA0E2
MATVNIAGVNIPSDKKVPYALMYIYGIGKTRAFFICKSLNIDENSRTKDLSEDQLTNIRNFIDENYKTENDLKREKSGHIISLKSIRCYRGLRHLANLPVRGQRTNSNAETRRKGII